MPVALRIGIYNIGSGLRSAIPFARIALDGKVKT